MLQLTGVQIRWLGFLTVLPWLLLAGGLCLSWNYFSLLWTDMEARLWCMYLLLDYVAALCICFACCIGVNSLCPPGEERLRTKRGLLVFVIFFFAVLAMIPVWFCIIALPAYLQLQRSAAFGQSQ